MMQFWNSVDGEVENGRFVLLMRERKCPPLSIHAVC